MPKPSRHPPDDAPARFRSIFDSEARAVLGFALRRVADPEDAADVVAETFAVAWRRIADVPPGDDARLWLFGVARHVLANHRRGTLRRQRLAERLRDELVTLAPVVAAPRPDNAVGAAIAALPAEDREVLLLTGWEGFAPAEIAVVLGLPPATVRTRLHRARGRLRAALEASGELVAATPSRTTQESA